MSSRFCCSESNSGAVRKAPAIIYTKLQIVTWLIYTAAQIPTINTKVIVLRRVK
jgi:hypothetical protein